MAFACIMFRLMYENPKKTKNRRVFILVTAINVLFLALVFLSVREASAQTVSDSEINYTVTSACSLTVVFPYDLQEQYTTLWGNSGSSIRQYAGQHPATTTSEGSKTGFTFGTVGDWVSNWQQGYNGSQDGTVSGNSVTWSDISSHSSGSWYWYWSFPDGNTYYAQFFNNVDGTCEPVNVAEYNQPAFNTAYNTKFESVTASSSDLLITHYVDPDEYNPNISEFNPDLIRVRTALVPTTEIIGQSFTMSGITGTHTTNADLSDLVDGEHDVFISFANAGCVLGLSDCPFPLSYVTLRVEMASGTIFSIVGTPQFYDSTTFIDETADQPCGVTNIQGCIVNAMRSLFVPSSQSISQFSDTWQDVRTKPPFGYVTSIIDETQTLTSTTTPAWEMPDLPFVSAVFDPIKTALAVILWGIFGVYFYMRVTKIEL